MGNIYKGNEPFVFISYAHKDEDTVLPIVEALKNRGVRLWYDAEIRTGAEWPEYIAAKLKDSACVLCFVSHSYDISSNCRRELTFSLNRKIPTVSIFLERCRLSVGLELQLGLAQGQYYDQFPSADALADNLVNSSMVGDFRTGGGKTEKKKSRRVVSVAVRKSVKPNVTNLLKRAAIALEDGDWEDAAAFCDQVLNQEPENPQAYLTLLLAQMQVKNVEQLAMAAEFSEDNKHYKKLLRFADEETKAALAQALTKKKSEKPPTTLATMTWEEFVEAVEKEKTLRVENETTELDDFFAQIFEEDEALCDEADAAEVEFKKNATIENGVLEKYTGSEAHVVIPDSVTSIGDRAFCGCISLTSVTIPSSVTVIDEDAFERCSKDMTIFTPEDSYAWKWAEKNHIPVRKIRAF